MEYFIFGLDKVLPLFIVMAVGLGLKKKGIIDEKISSGLTTIVFYIALPAKLFIGTANSDLADNLNMTFIMFAVLATFAGFLVITAIVMFFVKDLGKASAMIHAGFRGNLAYIGLPLIQGILGKEVIAPATLILVVIIPLYNVLAILLLSICNNKNGTLDIRKLVIDIVKNPLIIAILIGIVFSLLNIKIHTIVDTSLQSLGSIATPMSLILIGAGLRADVFKNDAGKVIFSALYKVVIQTMIFMPLALKMNFNQDELVTLFILFSVPTANNVYIMTKQMGGDAELASGISVLGLLMCIVTLPLGIVLLGKVGVI